MSPEVALLALRLALALVLYAFLGTTLLYVWRDLRSAGAEAELAPQGYLELLTDSSPGSTYPLATLNLLGRAADNTIRIDETTVSGHHARLSFQGGQWWLEDLGSKNGTGVNELDLDEPMVVTYGDHIRLGTLKLELKAGTANKRSEAEAILTEPIEDSAESFTIEDQ
jgi:pSer/pThr/pTyr-binding forkhead associated (FHA) protein